MLMTQFSLPVLMTPSADFYIFSNTWPHDFFFSSMDPNVSKCQLLTGPCRSPSFPLPYCRCRFAMQLSPFVLPSSLLLRTFHLLMFHSFQSPVLNILGSFITPTPSSVPDVNFRCSQASSPSRHSIHSFDILSLRFKLQV